MGTKDNQKLKFYNNTGIKNKIQQWQTVKTVPNP